MDAYTTGRSRTGHYRKPGSHLAYCGPHALARTTTQTRMCTRCVKAEALDRAAATATAEAWLDTPPASPLAAAERETAGTWRAEWIGARTRATAPTLFDVDPDTEQGALFA
jgi:hypothetical protein